MENLPEVLAVGSAGLALRRVLGPSLDTLGDALNGWTEYKLRNIGRAAENADRKLGKRAEQEGQVSPRAAMRIFQEAGYSDDELIVDYLGGVLASSRSPSGRDDRGIVMTALVSRLSTYQLRTHYLIYSLIREAARGKAINLYEAPEAERARVFIPFGVYEHAMEVGADESFGVIIRHSLTGLEGENLIHARLWGDAQYLNEEEGLPEGLPGDGVVVSPTDLGGDLYLWGMGQGHRTAEEMFDEHLDVAFTTEIPILPGSRLIRDLRAEQTKGKE